MSSTIKRLKIVYIAGEGRSGSTIFGNILGEIDGLFFIGEAMNIWRHFLLDKKLCACGIPGPECPEWQRILKTAFELENLDAAKMERLRSVSVRNRFVWKMFFHTTREQLRHQLSEYLDNLEKLYLAISEVTQAEVIVDSSKRPTYAFLLSMLPNVDIYTLHLVRDPRGVAYSWGKKKIQQELADKVIYMRQYSPLQSALRWDISNFLTELLLRKVSKKFLTLRYEDLIGDPKETLSIILTLLNLAHKDMPIVAKNEVKLTINHAIWGNPSRFNTGNVRLKGDSFWKSGLSTHAKRLISFLTWPGMRRYGY